MGWNPSPQNADKYNQIKAQTAMNTNNYSKK
jgi:hypothetical protein